MLKENANPFSERLDRLKRKLFYKRIKATSKGGLATPCGIKHYQDRFVMEGNNNLLFGTVNGSIVGMCLKTEIVNRNLNTLVLSGSTYKGWSHYTLPNLLAGHSSAVIVGDPKFYDYLPDILSKGINVFTVNFTFDDDVPTNKYNPFTKFHKPFPNPHYPYSYLRYLAKTVIELFHSNDAADPYLDGVYKKLLEYIFVYVGLSDNLADTERNFRTVKAVINDLIDNGKKALGKYLVKSKEDNECEDILEKLIIYCDDKIFNTVLVTMLVELQDLIICKTFEEDNNIPETNVTVEKLVNEKTYLFIPQPIECGTGKEKLVAFFLSVLLRELYLYGESDWKYSNQALANHVHFYLNRFVDYHIPYFTMYLATCRRYGIGISIITELWRLKRAYEKNEHLTILENVDTNLFLSTGKENADAEYIQEFIKYPVNPATGKEIPIDKHGGYAGKIKKWEWLIPHYATMNIDELNKLFSEDKAIVAVRDCYAIVCDVLKPDDYRSSEAKLGMIIDEGRNLAE